MRRILRHAPLIPALIALLGLSATQCEHTYGRQACRMEKELFLAETKRPPTAVATVSNQPDRAAFAWSADGAVTVLTGVGKTLNLSKQPSTVLRPGSAPSVAVRGEKTFWPQTAGLSIEAEDLDLIALPDGRMLLTMLELPGEAPGGAFAALLSPEGTPIKTVYLGPSGEYATKIVSVPWEENVLVAWHDGALSGAAIHLVLLGIDDGPRILRRSEFRGNGAASGPALAAAGGTPLLAWAESVSHGKEPQVRIQIARVARDLTLEQGKTVAEGRFFYPAPTLISDAEGSGLGLIFRDDADRDETPEFHFMPLRNTGAPDGEPQRISQADGLKGPSLDVQGGLFVTAAVRSFQRNLLIGLNRFDRRGVKQNGEFQVYADKTDFVRVDVAGAAEGMLLIYAEDKHTSGRVLAGRVYCGNRP